MNILAGFMSFVSVEGIIIIRNEELGIRNDGSYGSYGSKRTEGQQHCCCMVDCFFCHAEG